MQNRTFCFMELAPIKGLIPSEQLSVEKVITCDWDTMIHKILKKMGLENLMGKFMRKTRISKYEIRKINDLQIPNHGWNCQKKFFVRRCKGPEWYP